MIRNFIQKYNKPLVYGLSILMVLSLLLALFSQLTADGERINVFFCSDTLYLPSLYQDLVTEGNSFAAWHLNPAPNYFPDMLLYFILMFLSGNLLVSTFIFSVLQYLCLGFLCIKIGKQIFPDSKINFTSLVYGFLALLLLEVFFFTKDFFYLFHLLLNAAHAGTFILTLVCLVLTFNFISKQKWPALLALFIIGILAIISDRLFIVLYVLPVGLTCVLLYKKIGIKRSFLVMGILLLFASLGMFIHKRIDSDIYNFLSQPGSVAEWPVVVAQFKLFFSQILDYMTDFGFRALSIYLFIISFFLMIYVFFDSLKRKESILISFYSLFFLLMSVGVICAPMLSGKYLSGDCIRYNVYPFFLGGLNLVAFTAYKIKTEKRIRVINQVIIGLTVILLGIGLSQLKIKGLQEYFAYYPETVKQIDALAEKEGLKTGVGNFWEAKKITVFSKKGIKVYAVFDDISFYQHAANDDWYYNNVFNFVVISGIADTSYYSQKLKDIKWLSNTPELKLVKTHPFCYLKHLGSTAINLE